MKSIFSEHLGAGRDICMSFIFQERLADAFLTQNEFQDGVVQLSHQFFMTGRMSRDKWPPE